MAQVSGRNGLELRLHSHGRRFVCWVGKLTVRQQREYERHVQAVIDAFKIGASVEPEALQWFESVPPRIREKFVAWGMLPALQRRNITKEQRTVGGWTELYIDELKVSVKTTSNYHQARTWLLKFIDPSTDLTSVTPGDMKRWQASMGALALSTRNKHLKRVKTMLAGAVEDGLLARSPAAGLKEERSKTRIDRTRQEFVPPEDSAKVLEHLPNTTWRLIFALMRFQGLRRHEVFALEWTGIDWAENTLTVPGDTKTGQRTMPIFPEVLSLLQDAFEIAQKGDKVVSWARSRESVTELLRKRVTRILGRCWPKPCHQLRAARRTELERMFPSHVVNEWLGHSSDVAERHYLQITANDKQRASSMRTIEDRFCTASCTADWRRLEAHRAEPISKNPGKPTKTRVKTTHQRPQQDSNIGRFDPIKTRVGTVLEGSRTAARTAEMKKTPRFSIGGVATGQPVAVEHLSDADAKMLALFGCLTDDQQRHALEWLGELAGVVVEVEIVAGERSGR